MQNQENHIDLHPTPTTQLHESAMVATLKYLESQSEAHPELDEWYATLANLYEKKLWHQLTLKINQFFSLFNFKGFVAKLEIAPDGSVNLMIWKCIIPGKNGVEQEKKC